jgi:hypothetical protein
MNLKRFRDPLVAALGALLIGGVSVAMAAGPNTPTAAPSTTSETQATSNTAGVEKVELSKPDSAAEAAGTEAKSAEADAPGGHADNANDPNADHQFDGVE